MLIELTGCTSAGKSTLARELLEAFRQQKTEAWMGDEFVLRKAGLNWVRNYLARMLLLDSISFLSCLATNGKNGPFCKFATRMILRLPRDVGWFEKLNIARNVFKQVGIYEIARRATARQIVIMDEGTLHSAHYLFVHTSIPPDFARLLTFSTLVPLPDVLVYLRQERSTLVERTLTRGHKRIPGNSQAGVECFIGRAVNVFEKLAELPVVAAKLVIVDGHSKESIPRVVGAAASGNLAGIAGGPSKAVLPVGNSRAHG